MGILNILGPEGHTELTWEADRRSTAEVRRRFDELVRLGYLTFTTDLRTNESELTRTFRPDADRITAMPPIQGG